MKNAILKKVIVYSTKWCSDCLNAKMFLSVHKIPYDEVDIERDEDAAQKVLEWSGGRRVIPTFEIHFAASNGKRKILHNPPLAVLAQEMGIIA